MKLLHPAALLLLPLSMYAQQDLFWDESSSKPDYSVKIMTPNVMLFAANDGKSYIRTLVKAPEYNSASPYFSGQYDSLVCNSKGLAVEQFRNPEYDSYITKYVYAYDDSGRIISRVTQRSKDGTWNIREREKYEYNPRGEMVLWTFELYKEGMWKELLRQIYKYDAEGKIIEDRRMNKSNGSETYDGESITVTTYNNKGGFLKTESGNVKDGVWIPSYIQTRTYDENFYLLEYKDESNYSREGWSINYRYTYTRDSLGRPLTCVFYGIPGRGASYIKMDSSSVVYGGNNHIIESEKFDFLPAIRTHKTYTYAEDGRPLTILTQESSENFNKKTKTAYAYSADGKLLHKVTETWDDVFSIWKGTAKIEYFYSNIGLLIKAEAWDGDKGGWIPARYASYIEIPGDKTYRGLYVEFKYTALEDLAENNSIPDSFN